MLTYGHSFPLFHEVVFVRVIYIYIYMTGVNQPLYYRFLLRSYRCFARVPHESRKVPAREAASDPNERLVT